MSGDGDDLGRSIKQAVRFLRQVYQDVAQLMTALDDLLADRQWQPTEKNRTSYWLSNSMEPKRWVLDHQCRWYVHAGALENYQELIAFAIIYDPPSIFDVPVVLGTAAYFATPTNTQTVLPRWPDFGPLVEALGATECPRSLSAQEVKSFMPTASHVAGLVVPLCRLTGTDTLDSLCVTPVLAMEKRRWQDGEAKLVEAQYQALDRSGGKYTADVEIVGTLCRQYGLAPVRAEAMRDEVWKKWWKDRKP